MLAVELSLVLFELLLLVLFELLLLVLALVLLLVLTLVVFSSIGLSIPVEAHVPSAIWNVPSSVCGLVTLYRIPILSLGAPSTQLNVLRKT